VTLAPVGALTPDRAQRVFEEQIRALVAAGVDLILIETMPSLQEALIALAAARAACGLPVAVSLTYGEGDITVDGSTPEQVAHALEAAGADVIGANCSSGPTQILDIAVRLAAAGSRPVSAMPNAGLPAVLGGRYVYTSSPAYMADVARQMVDAGVRIVGGCCGTTPEHIAALRSALEAPDGPRRPTRLEFPAAERIRAPARARMQRPTRLQDALHDRFVVTVEVDPPNGFDVGGLVPKLRALRDSGAVDAFNVADSPRARARMSALAAAALIQGELGSETVLHMACRHRNLVAVHSELLGAHALDIRNVLVVMGDPPAMGDYPDATAVNDITATGLMALLATFNRGLDLSGRPLDDPTAFHIGCAFNFHPAALERELALLDKKIEAGAQFALSQPVYDPRIVERVLDRCGGRLPIPILLGVLPLWNDRHATFLDNEVPGIEVPDAVLRRMRAAGDSGRDVGVAVAREMVEALRGGVQGAYFMPPFGRYDLVPEVMAGIGREAVPV
jgi:homocysteine S-methyltransferase